MNPLLVQGAAQLLLGKYKSHKGMLMKNILTMAATGLVIFAGLGWYLDWYKVKRTASADGKQHISIDLNTNRIGADLQRGREQVTQYLNQGGFPSPTPPAQPPSAQPYPTQPYQQPFPYQQQPYPTSYPPAYPNQSAPGSYPPPTYPQPNNNGWIPATPTARPSTGGFVFPGNPQPAPSLPGRPF